MGSYLLFQPLKWIRYSGIFLPFSSFPTIISTIWNKQWIACIKRLDKKWTFQHLGIYAHRKKSVHLHKLNTPRMLPLSIYMSRRYGLYSRWENKLFSRALLKQRTAIFIVSSIHSKQRCKTIQNHNRNVQIRSCGQVTFSPECSLFRSSKQEKT